MITTWSFIMRISETTQLILRNFANINQSVLLTGNNRISTWSIGRNILVSADIEEEFPDQFGIYDLPRFLGNLAIYPDLTFEDEYVIMSNGTKTYKFMAADPSTIVYPTTVFRMDNSENNPEDCRELPQPDFDVNISEATLSTIKKVASINSLPDYALTADDGIVNFVALDKKSDTSDIASEPVGVSDVNFRMYFKNENLRIIDGDYFVGISTNKISTFRHQTLPVQYWITMESDSEYDI